MRLPIAVAALVLAFVAHEAHSGAADERVKAQRARLRLASKTTLDATEPCCRTDAEVTALAGPLEITRFDPRAVKIRRGSPVLERDGAKSWFAVFELKPDLQIRIYPGLVGVYRPPNGGPHPRAGMFCPVARILRADGSFSRELRMERPLGEEAPIVEFGAGAEERYLVIETDAEQANVDVVRGDFPPDQYISEQYKIACNWEGTVHIRVKP